MVQRLQQAWRVMGDAHGPLYRRLHRVLRDAINKQVLAPHETLPAERDMAQALKISVEATQSYYRGDAYDFVAELNTIS